MRNEWRINFGEQLSIPQEKQFQFMAPWIPVTPEKPITTRSNQILFDRHGNHLGSSNWAEQAGYSGGQFQETLNYNGAVPNFNQAAQMVVGNETYYGCNAGSIERNRITNHIAGSHTRPLYVESSSWNNSSLLNPLAMNNVSPVASANRTINRSMSLGNRPLIPNLHSQVENWGESNSADLMFATQANYFTNLLTQGDHFQPNGFPIPYQPSYNQNTPPRIEADSASCVTPSDQFTPVAQDQATQLENQLSITLDSSDKMSSQGQGKQKDLVIFTENEPTYQNCSELLQHIVDSSSTVVSTTLQDKRDSESGCDQGIDLNKTPQVKPPKRRKHRPKVVVEGKPKRTPKAETIKNINKENPSGKRKYVRKKPLKESANQNVDRMGETTNPDAGAAAKSCRRVLNFDLEKSRDEGKNINGQQEEMQHGNKRALNLNSTFQAAELCSGTYCGTSSPLQISQPNGLQVKNQQLGSTSNAVISMNQMPSNHTTIPEKWAATVQLAPTENLQMETLNADAITDTRNVGPSPESTKNKNSLTQQHIQSEDISQNAFQAKTTGENFERTRERKSQGIPQSVQTILSSCNESRGYKRGHCHAIDQTYPHFTIPMGSLLCQEILQTDDCHRNRSFPDVGYSETYKKKKSNGFQTHTYTMPSSAAEAKEHYGKMKTRGMRDVNSNELTSQTKMGILNSQFESNNITKSGNKDIYRFNSDWYVHSMASASGQNSPKQHISSELHSFIERMQESLHQVPNFSSSTRVDKCNLLPPTPPKKAPAPKHQPAGKHQIIAPTSAESVSSGTDRVLQKQLHNDHQQSFAKKRGRSERKAHPITIDEIIQRLKDLNLNERSNENVSQEHNAIVPYKGDGAVVPYEGNEFIKKRKPRPKVDLDAETDRVWKLLMEKEASEGIEKTDTEKEKWWEEERRVFRGRADSFIARMHLVQGDRRFSKWKGSVVDSVIGVFLTQNVSDHLSSSAFMSLAARFPIKPMSNRTCDSVVTNILTEEPEACLVSPNDNIKWHEKEFSNPLYIQSSMGHHQSTGYRRESQPLGTERTSLVDAWSHNFEEEVISSQDSFDSSTVQGNGGIRSHSGSNSEVEDLTGRKPNTHGSTLTNLLQMENFASFDEFFSQVSGSSWFHEGSKLRPKQSENIENSQQRPRLNRTGNLQGTSTINQPVNYNPQMLAPVATSSNYQLHRAFHSEVVEIEGLTSYGEESISSWPSTASRFIKAKDTSCVNRRIGQLVEGVGTSAGQQNGPLRNQESLTMDSVALLSKNSVHQESIYQPESHNQCNQSYFGNHQNERNKTFQQECSSVTTPAEKQNGTLHIPSVPKFKGNAFDVEERMSIVNKQILIEDKFVEAYSREQVHATGQAYNATGTNITKTRKGKVESEKKNIVDWESLRKQVQDKGRKKERSRDTMDSLDYEAVRCANVKEISDAIKERGMNNMLAERMKEFLNRLVKEHGSIDLEWLRDIPPEKAKDYLLSMRGLGLKSVECVRLLTLHHLAFPVDTNVGRIAVRLGWVPLQPLPESLQLHLLELYPVLESIQKYLWPRLCKLDQRTLYELHYQLITFGKVFCTKSKPNCNACPMRGECRHFASAFASARLALPGPEEKSVISSIPPIRTETNTAVFVNHVPLPPPEHLNNSPERGWFELGSCEPIIEEPATPQQEFTDISETDIEDTFDEDPDEIPTIQLNIEEFAVNLQNYMQENMELQEGDMSKALVALNPEAASIPTPKLKNVSRLRTEHQVYELPDSHPLLKGMDRREPDDPSPYLLAIWTPGETANSIQPPEQQCRSQEPNKLCNDKTCFSCNSIREATSQTVRGTLLIPCRTAMRGSFPLNGTYFQVNEVFADHGSSLNPIDVPRAWLWNLPRRIVYFGTSVSSIFRGLSTEGIQYCFWKGFVCVRGFDQDTRAPRPLMARLHFPASKLVKKKDENKR